MYYNFDFFNGKFVQAFYFQSQVALNKFFAITTSLFYGLINSIKQALKHLKLWYLSKCYMFPQ